MVKQLVNLRNLFTEMLLEAIYSTKYKCLEKTSRLFELICYNYHQIILFQKLQQCILMSNG